MGKKYIYGKINAENPFLVRENEFHFLCKYLGAYLKYEKEKDFHKGFEDYLKKYNIKEAILNNDCWHYINEAQKFIRNNLNETERNKKFDPLNVSPKHNYSKREIRKLGFYGALTTPAIPKSACEIETELFNTIFNNEEFNELAVCFNNYLFDAWKRNDNKSNYFTEANPNAINVTTTYFIGFQQIVIDVNYPKHSSFFRKFKNNSGYRYIQKGLDERHP